MSFIYSDRDVCFFLLEDFRQSLFYIYSYIYTIYSLSLFRSFSFLFSLFFSDDESYEINKRMNEYLCASDDWERYVECHDVYYIILFQYFRKGSICCDTLNSVVERNIDIFSVPIVLSSLS